MFLSSAFDFLHADRVFLFFVLYSKWAIMNSWHFYIYSFNCFMLNFIGKNSELTHLCICVSIRYSDVCKKDAHKRIDTLNLNNYDTLWYTSKNRRLSKLALVEYLNRCDSLYSIYTLLIYYRASWDMSRDLCDSKVRSVSNKRFI